MQQDGANSWSAIGRPARAGLCFLACRLPLAFHWFKWLVTIGCGIAFALMGVGTFTGAQYHTVPATWIFLLDSGELNAVWRRENLPLSEVILDGWWTQPFKISLSLPSISWQAEEVAFGIPVWLPFVVLMTVTIVLWRPNRRRAGPGHCASCGYDLKGNTSGVCPECGEATNSAPSHLALK